MKLMLPIKNGAPTSSTTTCKINVSIVAISIGLVAAAEQGYPCIRDFSNCATSVLSA